MLAGGKRIKSQPNQRSALLIDRHDANLAAFYSFADVEVANWREADRAALDVLALKTTLDLLAIPTRAEGVYASHDGVEQKPVGTVIDSL